MNTVTVFLRVTSKAREEFLQTFRSLSNELKGTQGLKTIQLYQDVDDANAFHLAEEWMTWDDLNKHLDSERFRVLMGALQVLSEEAEVRYQLGPHPIEDRNETAVEAASAARGGSMGTVFYWMTKPTRRKS